MTPLEDKIAQLQRRTGWSFPPTGQLKWISSGEKTEKSIHPTTITLFSIMCTNNNDNLMNEIKEHLFEVPPPKKKKKEETEIVLRGRGEKE